MNHPAIEQQITFLYTQDLQATARFYEDVIGLKMVLDQGTCRIYHIASGGYLGFCQIESLTDTHEDIIFTLVTPEVDQWHKYLRAKSVIIEKPPMHNLTYNIYHLTFRDPNGYLIEIQKFLDPGWDESTT
ncbi:MAG: VOC family protein [Anaerolineales bacterium]